MLFEHSRSKTDHDKQSKYTTTEVTSHKTKTRKQIKKKVPNQTALQQPSTWENKNNSQAVYVDNTSDKNKSDPVESNSPVKQQPQRKKHAIKPIKNKKSKKSPLLTGTTELREINSTTVCHYCDAKKFEFESPTFCCDNGKIRLANTVMPPELLTLFTDTNSRQAEDFRKRIRVYNSTFAFTSFGVKLDTNLASSRHGIYTFRALGQIFHTLPPLTPIECKPSHFQLYFWDSNNELTNRMRVFNNADVCEDTIKLLMDVMKKNPYVQLLHRINDFPCIEDVTLQICKNAEVDQRCYNNPTADQVAAIWIEGNIPNIPYDREILLHGTDGKQHRIKHYYGCYDPLQYPLLFPNGENGWHQNIPKFTNASIVLHTQNASMNTTKVSTMESILQTEPKEDSYS